MNDASNVMQRVRRALGRGGEHTNGTLAAPPVPPPLPDAVVRLVQRGVDLPALFAQRAGEMKMIVTQVSPDALTAGVVDFVRGKPIQSVALSDSPLIERLGVRAALEAAGVAVKSWNEISLDAMYEYDCAITTVDYAVAESGTFVIKPSASQGRSMSLVPMYHIAIIERGQFLADMIDLFELLATDPDRSNYVLISGPSKTADIEMNVVTGVHGPNVVAAFVVE